MSSPSFNLRSFGSKCIVLKKQIVALLGHFGAPALIPGAHSDLAPGELCPLCPHVTLRSYTAHMSTYAAVFNLLKYPLAMFLKFLPNFGQQF